MRGRDGEWRMRGRDEVETMRGRDGGVENEREGWGSGE